MQAVKTIYVIDPDPESCSATLQLLKRLDIGTASVGSVKCFLDEVRTLPPGAVLLNYLQDSGARLFEELPDRIRSLFPIIAMTADADVAAAVGAMKAGACDFLEMPLNEGALRDAVDWAWTLLNRNLTTACEQAVAWDRMATLTPRERDVLVGLTSGLSNKLLARELHISVRTVEMHRRRMMDRLGASSVGEAIWLAFIAQEPAKWSRAA